MSDRKLETGVFVFSWDFELAWGFHDLDSLPARFHAFDSRSYIGEIVDILERNDVSSTWGTVGHLLLEECRQNGDYPHSNLLVPRKDWYNSDPCTNVREDPLWYASDLINRLRSCKSNQEIGSHTFSHVTTRVDDEVLTCELEQCQKLAQDGEMRTFISPRHGDVPVSLLADTGYSSYRAPSKTPAISRVAKFYTGIGGPKTAVPTRESNGVWRHPVSTYFFYNPIHRLQQKLPQIKRRWFESGIKRAISNNEVFHVWAHPHNFIGNDNAIEQFDWLISRISELQKEGLIKSMTMSQLTEQMNDNIY